MEPIRNYLNQQKDTAIYYLSETKTQTYDALYNTQEKIGRAYQETMQGLIASSRVVSHFISAITLMLKDSFCGIGMGVIFGAFQHGIIGLYVGAWVGGLIGLGFGIYRAAHQFEQNFKEIETQ